MAANGNGGAPPPAAASPPPGAISLPFTPPPGAVPVQYFDPATGKTFVVFQQLPAGAVPVGAVGGAAVDGGGGAVPAAAAASPSNDASAAMADDASSGHLSVAGGADSGRDRASSGGSLAPPGSNRSDRASPPPPAVAAAAARSPSPSPPAAAAAAVAGSGALAVSPPPSAAPPFAHLSVSVGGASQPKSSPLSASVPSLHKSPAPKPDIKEMPAIKLAQTRHERAYYDNLSDLYSIVVTMEHLEKAYVRESVDVDEYTRACQTLLAQFKTCKEALKDTTPDMAQFYRDYHLETCRQAILRLKEGVPATVLHGGGGGKAGGGGGGGAGGSSAQLHVFHAVQHFITTMDALKLDRRAVDELHPTLSDLLDSVNKVGALPPDHASKAKVRQWLLTLGGMKAHDELTAEQVRQMAFDLDQAYNALHRFVQDSSNAAAK